MSCRPLPPASGFCEATLPVVWTPKLSAAVADYCDVMGFDVVQQVTGVFALLRLGKLHLQLWQRGAQPGRWEQELDLDLPDRCGSNTFRPDHHRVVLDTPFEVYDALQAALRAHKHNLLTAPLPPMGLQAPERQRLSGPPKLQAWGTWEFTLRDANGNVLRFVQWVSSAATLPAAPSATVRLWRQT
ncbi:MAG: hypothetical protein A3E79_19280 [Burkholderiales bacterium RIFCSPHIGHO2_12_FULL_61_11]|nr:MAG: hypothetical protein A3E79_19280 [Burkholderiales bacterium RIFCSPHIGHO2_12_FULL_61_11]